MSIAAEIAPVLPYLRRYARALTGSQAAGDALVAKTLETIIADRSRFASDVAPRLALYRLFEAVWLKTATAPTTHIGLDAIINADPADPDLEAIAETRLAGMTPLSRQALLLGAMEGFTTDDVGYLLDRSPEQVQALTADALAEIARQTAARVMIIEDESIIALDIETIVRDLGHIVTGTATTHAEALTMFRADTPGLVLADIQLADASSGVDAVRDILLERTVPVIFITAFPEQLLTGERPEPTFLIAKPFHTATVQAAIAQALFFNSTATPHG